MIDRVLADPVFPEFVAALVSPFLLWAAIAMMARRKPEMLPRIYPAAKVAIWGLWIFLVVWGMYGITQTNRFFRTTAIIWPLYGGIKLIHQWMRRRIEPDVNQPRSTEGWWPAPKDKVL